MLDWIGRVKNWVGIGFKDPADRIERAMVRVLLLGGAGLALVGFVDLVRLRTPESALQFTAAGLLTALALWMDRTGRAYPRTILVFGALAPYLSILLAAMDEDYSRLTDSSPTVFISITGVLALILGGRWARRVAVFWISLLTVAVATARWPVTHSVAQVATDVATVLIISALAFIAAIAIRSATLQGRAEYEQLVDTAPVGILELDLRGVRNWLLENRFHSQAAYAAAVESGTVDPLAVVGNVVVLGFNETAGHDLFLNAAGEAEQMDSQGARVITNILTEIVFAESPGSIEVSFEYGGDIVHRVMTWSANTADRRNVVIVSTDITAQKAAEKALEDQIRDKDEFIASVSHELRTPLTAVVGLVDEITRSEAPISSGEKDELMSIVSQQSHEVADIVEDLLVAARAAGGNLSTSPIEFDLTDTVSSTIVVFAETFAWDLEDGLVAYADPSRVRQIIRNLATNAIRYGGNLRRISAFRDGEVAVVEVRDNGEPIPPDQRESMFQPYERARHSTGGRPESVGLGLTVAKSLALTMAGDLSYDHDGDESIFRLVLPAQKMLI